MEARSLTRRAAGCLHPFRLLCDKGEAPGDLMSLAEVIWKTLLRRSQKQT